jgi:SAM-dependent methyltransferase
MGELDTWQHRVEEFVLSQIGDSPTWVLEVGCGEGELALALARAGHSVTAIDPMAPEGPIFRRARIEDFSDPARFDHVVAILSLHHVEDLGTALGNIADLLRTGGSLVVVEFAWDRIDEATAEWALERLPAASPSEKPSWLGRCRRELACGGRGGGRASAESYFAKWAGGEGFHSSRRMRDELGRRFVERLFEWVPYFYPDLGESVSEANERAAIESGTINATGFRYVGIRTTSIER